MTGEKNFTENEQEFDKLLNPEGLRNLKSKHPLLTLRRNLLINLLYSLLITILTIILIAIFWIWQVQLALLIITIFNVWYLIQGYKLYNAIAPNISPDNNLLSELELHYNNISKWVKLSEKIAFFIYPFSIVGGFLLGGVLGSNLTVEEFLKPRVLQILFLTILVVTPLTHFLAKYMNRQIFGKHLKDLSSRIDDLKQ